jgi:hypothetical protein
VVVAEAPLLTLGHDLQVGTDGMIAGRQGSTDGLDLGLDPGAVGEQWSEGIQDGYDPW